MKGLVVIIFVILFGMGKCDHKLNLAYANGNNTADIILPNYHSYIYYLQEERGEQSQTKFNRVELG